MEPQRDIRKLNGVEPLRKKESPSKVYVGHSSIISDFAEKETRGKKKNRPVVGIHLGDVVPPVWGQEMDYHFTLHNPSELVGRFPPLTQKMSFVEATGLDRADEIIFICINPDRGIFYGEDSAPEIPIHFVSTLLERIPKERLKGKKVKVIYNEESEIEGQSPVGDELKGLSQELGFEFIPTTPEMILINKMTEDLSKIESHVEDVLEICLLGQGSSDEDSKMLERFKKALETISIVNKKINVSLLRKKKNEENPLDPSQILKKSDYIVAYGDTDITTSTLVRLLKGGYQVDPSKIHAVVERKLSQFDFKNEIPEENLLLLAEMILT